MQKIINIGEKADDDDDEDLIYDKFLLQNKMPQMWKHYKDLGVFLIKYCLLLVVSVCVYVCVRVE